MIEGRPGKGHLYALHWELMHCAKELFADAIALGPIEEASTLVTPVLRRKHFKVYFRALFPYLNLDKDVERISLIFDQIPGKKFLHVYEGGFREFLLLMKVLERRTDTTALFNFFFLDPWLGLLNSRSRLSKAVRASLATAVTLMKSGVIFTCDSIASQKLLASKLAIPEFPIYPLFSSLKKDHLEIKPWDERKYSFLLTPRTRREKRLVIKILGHMEKKLQGEHNVAISARWNSTFSQKALEQFTNSKLKISLVAGGISKQQYSQLFYDTKVLVLPYLDNHYHYGSSGKALDGIMANCYVVAPSRTSVSDLATKHQGIKSFEGSANSLFEVLSGLDLGLAPRNNPQEPSPINAMTEILSMAQTLESEPLRFKFSKILISIPFATGLRGIRWAGVHLVAAPGVAFISFIKNKTSNRIL